MPFGMKPSCSACKTSSSPIWKKNPQGEVLCLSCNGKQNGTGGKDGNGNGANQGPNGNNGSSGRNNGSGGTAVRKSSRIKPAKHKFAGSNKPLSTKGKGRRIIFKKTQPMKAPSAVATVVTGESIFHDEMYYQVGDIVSLVDHGSQVYYAQLRGFLKDQYNEKSAVITWLLPTQSSPTDRFDPSTYILGPEEDLPRKLEFMEFVCHAPSDYYRAKSAPYPTNNEKPDLCFIWTSIDSHVIKPALSISEMFGMEETVKKKNAKEKKSDKSL
ncbi:hypothetical protein SNE40_009547 [Patella caerulea]|uniref:GATA zinc finger domain-containing protein 1 n=1 Tax=Patella caerulea TaxID=87958 RepID=A0AAN8JVP6_PATCE